MIRPLASALALALAAPAAAFDTLAVLAAGDPPGGPDADLAELAHQLRAACRDRIGGVMDVPTMRSRLLGHRSNATVTELDRAYGGALAVYQNGEFESAIRTLRAIVEDLESLPESEEAYAQWVRAQLRLAHAALTIGRDREADEAMQAVVRTEPSLVPDPDQYSPTYRRRFEAAKAKVRTLPARRLQVLAEGFGGSVFVNGRLMGAAPLSLWLPAGVYRVGGASGSLHVPSFRVDLAREDRSVVLDFGLAEALRVTGGPGLALPAPRRGAGIVRAGAWLGVDRVVAVTRQTEGDAVFLLGSIYDVRNGSLLREGSVRTVAGGVPSVNLGALATFLLTGQSSRDVKDRTELARTPIAIAPLSAPLGAVGADTAAAPPTGSATASATQSGSAPASVTAPSSASPAATATAPAPASARATASRPATASRAPTVPAPGAGVAAATPTHPDLALQTPRLFAPAAPAPVSGPQGAGRRWIRPGAYASAVLAGVFAGLAIHQGLSARQSSSDAEAMVGPGGSLAPGSDPTRYESLRSDARAATRNAYVSAGAAAVLAATAGVLGWMSRAPAGQPPALGVRF